MRLCDIKPINPTFITERPKLVKRARCHTFKPEDGCWDCGGIRFRYFAFAWGKRYYQCEKCRAISH